MLGEGQVLIKGFLKDKVLILFLPKSEGAGGARTPVPTALLCGAFAGDLRQWSVV